MTPREVRLQIAAVDRELASLESWLATLLDRRRQFLLDDSLRAREAIVEIDHGVGVGGGHSTGIANFDDGEHSGRIATETAIGRLRERRAVLVEEQLAQEQFGTHSRDVEVRATNVHALACGIDERSVAVRAALDDAARLAVRLAQDIYQVFMENEQLDTFCREADIPRPHTLRVEAPQFSVSLALSSLLAAHFTGGRPSAVDSMVARQCHSEPESVPTWDAV